jgi:glycosyltransferase involved in cell wall biosynthesis
VYNGEKDLKRTIDSVVNQPSHDYEIIIVDDGSKDSSYTIISEYVEKFPDRIKCIKSDNYGVSHARNLGISASIGKYIIFLDQDDIILPNVFNNNLVSKLYEYYNQGVDSIAFKSVCANSFVDRFVLNDTEIQTKQNENGKNKVYMISQCPIHFSFYNRKLFFKDGIRCFEKYRNCDTDMQFTHLLFYNSREVVVDNSIFFYCWINNPYSVSHDFKKYDEKYLNIIRAWKDTRDYHKKNDNESAKKYCESWICGAYYWLLLGHYGRSFTEGSLKKTLNDLDIQNIIVKYKQCYNPITIQGLDSYYNNKFKFIITSHISFLKIRIGNFLSKTTCLKKAIDKKKYPVNQDDLVLLIS